MILTLGTTRSKFGKWMDTQKDLDRFELEREANISSRTILKLCRNPDYRSRCSTCLKKNYKI